MHAEAHINKTDAWRHAMEKHHADARHSDQHGRPYLRLGAMLVFSFLAMYALMYAMVDRWQNVHHNLNQAWMAGLMVAPMLVIELLLMWRMYPHRRLNALLLAAGVAFGLACWWMIRAQAAIDDRQFLRSMIPHHAGALLMCERNRLRDPELQRLCRQIIASQRREIAEMQAKLAAPAQ
jgi:uncharacterized protein (DUF305 family)